MDRTTVESCVREFKRIRTHLDRALDQRTRKDLDDVIDRLEACVAGNAEGSELDAACRDGLRIMAILIEMITNVSELLERYLR